MYGYVSTLPIYKAISLNIGQLYKNKVHEKTLGSCCREFIRQEVIKMIVNDEYKVYEYNEANGDRWCITALIANNKWNYMLLTPNNIGALAVIDCGAIDKGDLSVTEVVTNVLSKYVDKFDFTKLRETNYEDFIGKCDL